MIGLSSLNEILNAEEQQQVQDSTLVQKAAESAATPQEYKLTPEAQNIVDEVQAGRERDLIRRRLAVYQDAMMQNAVNHFAGGSNIHIDPSKKGTFTAAASRHGMGVQEFASRVLANKDNYSPAMVKKANFARNASKWHAFGGPIEYADGGYIEEGLRRLGVTGFRVTSGYRGPGSRVGHAGKRSGHAKRLEDGSSGAIDIVPTSKTTAGWANLEAQLRSPAVQNFLARFGGTILDERDPATMRKTGATGPHFHVGLGVRGGGNFYGHSHDHAAPVQSAVNTGGYFDIPQVGTHTVATFGNETTQDSFTPWWQQVGQTDENFLAQQAAGAAGGAYDMTQFVPSWIEPIQNSATFPQLFSNGGCILPHVRHFADGGPYNDEFMNYYGYSWVPADQIYPSDPYFTQIQEHNPNGIYAVDKNGYYVPASVIEQEWSAYNSAPSINTPATAIQLPEASYTIQDKDLDAVKAAQRMFGDSRRQIYEDLQDQGLLSTDVLNKLDTLSMNPAYMGLNTDPERIKALKRNEYKLNPDGSLRAQYNTGTNIATIEPIRGRFLNSYLSEFVHNFQHNSNTGLDLTGYNPRAITRDRAVVDGSYNDPMSDEYKAHHWIQPVMNKYLSSPSMTYAHFVNSLKASQPGSIAQR